MEYEIFASQWRTDLCMSMKVLESRIYKSTGSDEVKFVYTGHFMHRCNSYI